MEAAQVGAEPARVATEGRPKGKITDRANAERKLAWLLKAVKDDVEFEGALVALPPGEHPGPSRDGSRGKVAHNNARSLESEDDAKRRQREMQKVRDRLAAWRLFVEAEFRGLRLRQEGQLGRLLGSRRRHWSGWPERTKDRRLAGWSR